MPDSNAVGRLEPLSRHGDPAQLPRAPERDLSIRRSLILCGALAAVLCASPGSPAAAAGPARVGQCASTRIREVGFRLLGTPGSGSAFSLANGVTGVSYDQVPAIDQSRPGDPVVVCLVSVPRGCPRGDDRGKVYQVTNRRSGASWQTGDSEHVCGGA